MLQMELAECGAAALGIILGHYKRFVPLIELRRECGISRDGSKASNILKAGQRYGLIGKGFKKSLEALKELKPPYIVFWNFNHFLVVEGLGKKRVYLNDPATGRRTVTLEEFDAAYTGIVLVLEPGPNFKKGGKPQNIFFSLFSRLRNSYGGIIFSLLIGLLITIPRLVAPAFTQIFVDQILIQEDQDWLRPLLWGMLITIILQALLSQIQLKTLRRLLIKLSVTLSGQFLWHTLHLPIDFYYQRSSGEVSDRTNLNSKVAEILTGRLAVTIIDTTTMGCYALLMFSYDRLLTSIIISFAAVNFLALYLLSNSRIDTNNNLALQQGKMIGFAVNGIQAIETVKASGLESDLFAKFAGYYTRVLQTQQKLNIQVQILNILPTFLTALATASILIVGGFRVMEGTLSVGMLVAFQLLATSFFGPINQLLNFGSTLQELEADINRLDDVLENPVEETEVIEPETDYQILNSLSSNKTNFYQLQGYIEFRDITFGYNSLEAPLIENFSLLIKPGQRIAIVGKTGSGKSTIAKLICKLYLPWQGKIFFDSIPHTQISRLVLANSLAMVEQDFFLFSGTVRENLTLWDATIPESDLIKACQDAAIHEDILRLPGNYNTKLNEGATNLSGGQRQRLEIARALVRNPTILVLDEATSALESETELIIDSNLRRRGCSCIIISHRLSTIRDCDEIIVLEKGKVVQRGTHEKLIKEDGIYSDLISGE